EKVAYRCVFRCQEKQLLSNGVADIYTHHFGFAYGTANIMCPLPSGCETPSSIAVTSADANSTSTSTMLTLLWGMLMEMPVCLSLVQSLEMLQLLGVNRVVVYKTSCSPETQRILDYYTQKGLLEVIPWSLSRYVNVSRGWLPEHGPGELHYFGQIPALNDCLYRYMYQSRYVALHDIDELILPQKVIRYVWVELLPLLENQYGANKCYMFENNVFPINVMLAPPASQSLPPQTDWKNVTGVNILAHLYQEPIIEETHYSNFKIIVNPRAVFATTVHGVLKSQHGCSWIDRNINVFTNYLQILLQNNCLNKNYLFITVFLPVRYTSNSIFAST
uniref:Glycosyltransferase family 92 protein n=1 Tax=Pundamilia nyererei TaxID=303518 RepID=A0A3B4FKY0_9CICH